MAVVFLSDLGHGEAARRTLNEAHTEAFLKQYDASAEPGLGQPERAGGGRKAPVVHDLDEEIQVAEVEADA
jgi:hypothetical protein